MSARSKRNVVLVSLNTSMVDLVHTAPLGPMQLAAYVRARRPGYTFTIIDQKLGRPNDAELVRQVVAGDCGVLGLSCFSLASSRAIDLARWIKELAPDITVVVGGPWVSADGELALAPEFDFAVPGEGEKTFEWLLRLLDEGGDPADVLGLIYRDATGRVVTNEPAPPIVMDELPLPAWDLIDPKPYWRREGFSLVGRRPYVSLMTSRGCPYGCMYCHNIFGKRFRARSPERVLADMHELRHRFGVREFEIIDDAFNIDRVRAAEILDRIATELPDVRLLFPNGVRGDLLDEAMIDKLAAAGTYYISFAIESASPRLQKQIDKNVDLDRIRAAMEMCRERGMMLNGFFMLGFPGETLEEMKQTVRFALALPLLVASFFFVMPYRGTALYRSLTAELRRQVDDRHAALHYDRSFINLSAVPDEKLIALQRRAIRQFYFRPRQVALLFRVHPRPVMAGLAFVIEMSHKMYAQLRGCRTPGDVSRETLRVS
jgi:radical SAM superfamily enzyme YgiQ (UPF0313 family)